MSEWEGEAVLRSLEEQKYVPNSFQKLDSPLHPRPLPTLSKSVRVHKSQTIPFTNTQRLPFLDSMTNSLGPVIEAPQAATPLVYARSDPSL